MSDSEANAASPRPRLLYRLADLTIDVGTAQVRRDDHLIPLPRLSFDLLLALVKAAPNLVTVDELMDQVWPGVVVNAETVGQRVKLLRVALGDDPRQPRYIAVSRGRGYRILGQVTTLDTLDAPAPAPAPPARPASPSTSTKLPRWAWAVSSVAVLAALATLFYLLRDRPQAIPTTTLPERTVAVLPFDNLGQSPHDAALAFGVAETLLHRLSASKDLTVIARQSSFSVAPRGADARDIGRKLNARYLVEGSLQSTPDRLRITAQLIDASTGGHVWSLQFDRKPEDIFVIQDEIAVKVTEAMRITFAGTVPDAGRGTHDFDSYLAHAQGRARLASGRVADAKLAIADFERAMQIDPKFTRAYAGLAEARLFVADNEMRQERRRNLDKVLEENQKLLEHALEINELDSDIHLQLAGMFWRDDRADKELARALELNPNSAPAYRLLATIRMLRDRLPDEAIVAIDKARLLSPLEVAYDNEKAKIALYGKSDVKLSEQLSLSVLDRDPSSTPALWRLGELYWCCGAQHARAIKYLEQALQRDPDYEFGRRILIRAYLDLDDAREAEAIAASAPHPVAARMIPALVHSREWVAATERGYEEDRMGTGQPIESGLRMLAMQVHAHSTRDFEQARAHFTRWSGITWDAKGEPLVPSTWLAHAAVGLAVVTMDSGDHEKGRRLIAALLKSLDDEIHVRGRGDMWSLRDLSVLYVLNGQDDEALTMLEKCVGRTMLGLRLFLATDHVYDRLRSHPRFQAVVEQTERYTIAQRHELDEMRAKGLVLHRTRR